MFEHYGVTAIIEMGLVLNLNVCLDLTPGAFQVHSLLTQRVLAIFLKFVRLSYGK